MRKSTILLCGLGLLQPMLPNPMLDTASPPPESPHMESIQPLTDYNTILNLDTGNLTILNCPSTGSCVSTTITPGEVQHGNFH